MKYTKIYWKNFLPYGDTMTEIDLDLHKSVSISGVNGHGKSTILDVFHFVLTGKPYRKIKKGQIPNSRNKKNCLAGLEVFNGQGKKIVIERGIKPDILTITIDGKEPDELSKGETQKYLNTLLNINPKTLKYNFFISSSYYTPFLEMEAANKRLFIDDILNIEVFSTILKNLKDRYVTVKKSKAECLREIVMLNANLEIINDMLKQQKVDNKGKVKEIKEEIKNLTQKYKEVEKEETGLNKDIKKYESEIEDLEAARGDLREKKLEMDAKYKIQYDKYQTSSSKGQKAIIELQTKRKAEEKREAFFDENDTCPSCFRDIEEDFKNKIRSEIEENIHELEATEKKYNARMEIINNLKIKLDKFSEKIYNIDNKCIKIGKDIALLQSNIQLKQQNISLNSRNIVLYKRNIESHKEEIGKVQNHKPKAIDDNRDSIKELIRDEEKHLSEITKEMEAYELSFKLLSDKGIKQHIVKKYIPVLNKYVNQYLELFQTHYRIIFNEALEETIVVKGYEKLTYHSLSAGEKARCNLCLLFAFLNVSQARNYVTSNILIMDEVADANLDDAGIDGLLEIIKTLVDIGYTPFIISPKNFFVNRLDLSYVAKKGIFSEIIKD